MKHSTSAAIRPKSTILVKPFAEGRPFNCFESNFTANTVRSRRVNRLHDINQKIAECLECSVECIDYPKLSTLNPQLYQEFYELMGNQPVFYLMETYDSEGRWKWNGRLLFSTKMCDEARQMIRDHSEELHIIMAFEDPNNKHFFFLVDTGADDLSDESFLSHSRKTFKAVRKYLPKVSYHQPNFYVRVLPEHYYEVLDRDALFGKPEVPSSNDEFRSCRPVSIGEVIRTFFGNVFTPKC